MTTGRMTLPAAFYEEENRSDYTVPADMKKVWAKELEHLGKSDYYDVVTSRIRAPKAPRLGEWRIKRGISHFSMPKNRTHIIWSIKSSFRQSM